MKLSEAIKRNAELRRAMAHLDAHTVKVLSNVTVNYLKDMLECHVKEEGINLNVEITDFDNIVQESIKLADNADIKIVFWELANISPGFHFTVNLIPEDEFNAIFEKLKAEISLVLNQLKKSKLVFFNLFSASPFIAARENTDRLCQLQDRLNSWLASLDIENVYWVDIDFLYQEIAISEAVDYRMFRSSKSLHTPKFFNIYSEEILPPLMSIFGKTKKVLVMDCDGTLWGGIIGEDGIDGIELSEGSKNGIIFQEVQSIVSKLARRGVIIGLNSKNNPQEVTDVFEKHTSMILRDDDIVIKRINWDDKVTNLKNMARELNVGIDSFVFVDDSSFEVNFIREQLPQVKTFQVPESLDEYPVLIRRVSRLFYNHSVSVEDLERVKMYKQEQSRQKEKEGFSNLNEYLQSLGIKINILKNDKSIVPRLAQMTQKTNQFNLTTKRYTEVDIKGFLTSDKYLTAAMEVSDRFGHYGITGLSIIELNGKTATVDSLMMSCRILGRNIETAFLNYLLTELKDYGVTEVESRYDKTAKNEIVKEFYEQHGFIILNKNGDERKQYVLNLESFNCSVVPHIEINPRGKLEGKQ